jgi:hypothetical protein
MVPRYLASMRLVLGVAFGLCLRDEKLSWKAMEIGNKRGLYGEKRQPPIL